MGRFALTRLVSLVGILLGLSVVVFLLQAVVPADPVRAMVGASATPEIVEAKRHELGLDQPLPAQYTRFLRRAVRGDLQMSLHTRRPVRTDIGAFLPATVELAATALALAVVLGGALGLLTARGGGTSLRVALVANASVPAFLLALLLLIVFYARLGWFPGSGRISPELAAPTGPTGLLIIDGLLAGRVDVVRDALAHLVLPALCLALGPAVALGRTLRSSLQTVLVSDHIRTARAKALTERGVLLRHGVRPALNAPLTLAGLQVGMLLAGVVVVEAIFAWPGLGLYTARAITTVDFPAIAGVTLVMGAIYVIVNALVDLAQVAADPRLRAR
jgi:peptide/nickel transport system permease protein